MAYIGKQPLVGNFTLLDSITATTTDTYALTKDSVAVFPQTPANCIVSLNGVIQAPTDSYTISGSNIIFASALTGSDSIDFITVLGDVLNVGTVSDGTIGLAKLSATGTKDATTFLRGDNTFASAGGANTPAFFVKRSSNQTVAVSTHVLVQFNSEDFDTDNCFDSTTNYRFTPTVSGKYFLEAFQYSTYGGTAPVNEYVRIRKNGTNIAESSARGNPHGYGSFSVATIASANGSTDYFDVTIYGDASGDYYAEGDGTVAKSSFKGFRIIE
jgi:hypothetical protein